MATTTNFGWETPDDTDLVKDGALAIRTLGNSIDTSLVDLKGGTTGQVLSKTSNTDMDFTWVTSDDANAIQNAIVDAKGDLIAASAADTPARLAVGNNGETLVADSSATTGLRWQGDWNTGKNKIINGDFVINQRAFSSTTSTATYTFDRFVTRINGTGTSTFSAQTFTAGTAPVAGYESTNYLRIVTSGQSGTDVNTAIDQRIESVRTFAGQTITVSFWAKAASGTPNIVPSLTQVFGSGGSSDVWTTTTKQAISTSWARYSFTFNVPSISGKTIGSGDNLRVRIWVSAGTDVNSFTDSLGIQTGTFEIWGVQAEAGSVATPFTTATGTLAGELAACQRYLPVVSALSNGNNGDVFCGYIYAANSGIVTIPFPTAARVRPTGITLSGTFKGYSRNTSYTVTPTFNQSTLSAAALTFTSGFTGTAGEGCRLQFDDGAYILFTGCEL